MASLVPTPSVEATRTGDGGALYARVKRTAPGGPFEAKFSRFAQTSLGPLLLDGDEPRVRVGGVIHAIGAKTAGFG